MILRITSNAPYSDNSTCVEILLMGLQPRGGMQVEVLLAMALARRIQASICLAWEEIVQ